VEAIATVLVGYGLAVTTQAVVFPIFGLQATLRENLAIGGIFVAVSVVRSYMLRRLFEWQADRAAAARHSQGDSKN
jgi:hypothetical protein